ncbi:MAG: tetratricopeptide repeat protein [Bryobacterales bacterium]
MRVPRGIFVIALAALFSACSAPPPSSPAAEDTPPQLDANTFDESIRERVRAAYEAVVAQPNDAAKNGELAMLLQAHSQFENSEAFYRRSQRFAPSAFNWTYYLAITQQRQAKHQDAVANFRAALKIDSGYSSARLHLAESLLALGELDEAGELYQSVIDSNSGIAGAHFGLGRVLVAKGETAAAVTPLQRACELGPRFGAAHYALAMAYRDLGEDAKAKRHLALYAQDQYGGPVAPDALLEEVKALKTGANVHLRRGVDLEKAGRVADAIAEHEKAVELDPEIVQARINLVILYGRLGNFEKANEHYQAALDTGAPHAELHYNFGVLAFGKGKVQEAKAAFARAIELNPQYAAAHNNLGFIVQAEGRLDEAERHFRIAIENQPNHRLARFHLGRLLAQKQRPKEAIAQFEKTLEPVDEQTPQFLYALAAAYDMVGERAKALEYAHRAQKLAVDMGQPQLAAKIEQDLKKLR